MNRTSTGSEARSRRLTNVGLPPPYAAEGIEGVLQRALVQGDDAALSEAMGRMRPVMIRIAMEHGRSADEAEDLIQETWVAALRGIRRFEGQALLRTWLLRILSYRARTMSRRAARSIPISRIASGALDDPERSALPCFGQRPDAPDDAVGARELHDALAVVLPTLPPKQREVFSLRALEGRSASDVCELLGLTPANQRVLLHRARSQVQRRLSVYWPRARRMPADDADTSGWSAHAGQLLARAMAHTAHLN